MVAIQVYAYGFFLPELAEITKNGMDNLKESSEEDREAFVSQLVEHSRKGRYFVHYPILALWIAASFSDDLREFLVRRSPD